MTFNPAIAYNDLPLLPPSCDVETKAILKKCLSATRALAELKGAVDLLPDQAILVNAILLQEAKFSSGIENIVTTHDELFKAAMNEANVTDNNIREILQYRAALRYGFESLSNKPLSLELILMVHNILCGKGANFRKPGEQIAIRNKQTKEIQYTPPTGGNSVIEKLKNMEQFLNHMNGLDPLIKMAIAHFQFEAILPFSYGNGRIGRILNDLYLISSGLLKSPVLCFSRYIINTKHVYNNLLRKVIIDGNMEPWILYILQGVEETALWTNEHFMEIKKLFDKTIILSKGKAPDIYSKELIELIFRQPYCKIGFLKDFGIAKRQSASKYLKKLEEIGILEGEKRGREMIFRHPALIKILQE